MGTWVTITFGSPAPESMDRDQGTVAAAATATVPSGSITSTCAVSASERTPATSGSRSSIKWKWITCHLTVINKSTWMIGSVRKAITPKQEEEALKKCVADLKAMA